MSSCQEDFHGYLLVYAFFLALFSEMEKYSKIALKLRPELWTTDRQCT